LIVFCQDIHLPELLNYWIPFYLCGILFW
jgi:hypothetical protein